MPTMSKTASSTPLPSDLRLSEYARKFTYPEGITKTVWTRVEAKGKDLGIGFDWWQRQLGTVALGYGKSGKYVASVGGVGMSIGRQVGKTYWALAMLFILCILFPGLQVVWTSHHMRTTTKTLTSARGFAKRKKIAPYIRGVRTANGEGQVEFTNGSVIMFGARSQGFGRGFDEIDVEVFDEAQILDTKALEDMVAATMQSRHQHGALLLYMGTPPRKTDPSDNFRDRRDEAWAGEATDAIWLEIGADPDSDPDDRDQWPLMNPSFPKWTPEESMLRLRKNLKDEDSWNREGRGIWDPVNTRRVIDETTWNVVADPASMATERLTLAIDVAPDRSVASVSLAGLRPDGDWHVELDDHRATADWAIAHVQRRSEQVQLHAVVVDELAGLTEKRRGRHYLKGTNVEVTLAASQGRDMAMAWATFHDSVLGVRMRHTDQSQVNVALSQAALRDVGGGKALSKKSTLSDITPMTSLTLALWGAQRDDVKKPTRRRAGSTTGGRKVVTM